VPGGWGPLSTRVSRTPGTRPELVQAAYVTLNLFPTLGVNPALGRGFVAEDELNGGDSLIVVSHAYWQSRLGGDSQAVGSTLALDGNPMTIVGVMPRKFRFLLHADVWRLVNRSGPFDTHRDSHSHIVIGRLKPGIALAQAQNEAGAIARSLELQYPETNTGKGLWLSSLQSYMVRSVRLRLLLLMATSALVLVIACANVAGLLLARGERRRAEMAMRSALGASRGRLVRQLLTESVILTVSAGLLGLGLAHLLQSVLVRLLSMGMLGIDRPVFDAWALGFALLVAVATGLLVGVIPAFRQSNLHPAQLLRSGTHVTAGGHSTRLRNTLVVLQVAVTTVLLIGSGLLIRSLDNLSRVDLGFEPRNLLTDELRILSTEYPSPEERVQFFHSLINEVEALPDVVSATLTTKLPIRDKWQNWSVWRVDRPKPQIRESLSAMVRWVSPGYFDTMQIPVVAGRGFSRDDLLGNPYVAVLSRSVARALFQDEDPLGRHVRIGWDDREFQVVGIAADARLNTLQDAPDGAVYMSTSQVGLTLVVTGLAAGIAAAYPGTLLIRQLLFGTQPLDGASYAASIGFLALVGFLACLLPAWRATRVDVMEVLRIG